MKQEFFLKLPARETLPETRVYTEIHTKSGHFGKRNILMLMPGGPGNDHTVCDYGGHSLAEALLPFVDVVLFDPRGCGRSDKSPIEHCTLEHYIYDVEALRELLKIPATQFSLMGVSYGGIAALGYGIKYGYRLKKLILVCGGVSGDFIEQAKKNLRKIGTPEQLKMGEQILNGEFSLTPETVSGYYETMGPLYSTTFKPGLPTPSITYNLELANLGFKTFLKEFDYRPSLSKVKCKTLIMAGSEDWISDVKQAQLIHQGIPGSQLIVYQNTGHMIWIDQWEKFLHDLSDFVSEP